jgi:hypothetical protein
VWFSRPKSGSDRSIQLCSETDGDGYDGTGGCAPPQLQDEQGFVGGEGTIKLIVSDRQVASVSALLPHGRSVSAALAFSRGFPDKVWLVSYPEEDNATVVMRDADGQVVKRLSIPGDYPAPSQPRSGGIKCSATRPERFLDLLLLRAR